MSKYHKGDKFIIEISEEDTNELDTTEYYRSNIGRVFEKEELDRLQKYNEPTISEDTLEMERMKALNEGRNEVWELVRRLYNTSLNEIKHIFGVNDFNWDEREIIEVIVKQNTPQEALAKLDAYKKEQAAFKRGDIVEFVDTDELAIYIGQYADGAHAVVFNDCNVPQKVSTDEIRKTDKNIDIQSVLL